MKRLPRVIALAVVASAATITGLRADVTYVTNDDWAQPPPGERLGSVSGVAIGPNDTVFGFLRDIGALWIFDSQGRFVRRFASGIAKMSHAVRVDRNGFIWTTDRGGHQVKKFNPDGMLMMTLGKYGVPGNGPDTFDQPTDVAVAPNGEFFVSDGYGNTRIVKFNKDGKFMKAWGEIGSGPGQFRLPHSIVIDSRNRLLVADRCYVVDTTVDPRRVCKDHRIQIFDTDGKFLDQWYLPGPLALDLKGDDLYVSDAGKVLILDVRTGKQIGAIEKTTGHEIAVDPAGNVYGSDLGLSQTAINAGQRTGGAGKIHRYTKATG
jgi:DNA-binding beta-propeller fold protein YncE